MAALHGAMPYALMYHSVAEYEHDPYQVTVRPGRFRRQLRWLRRCGLRGVSMSELLAARAAGRGRDLVGLTFDDGYRDFTEEVIPELRRLGWTATVFVLAGRLGGANEWDTPGPVKPLLTADEVRAAADAGMEIGSHGLRHLSLPTLSADAVADETARSREILRDLTGQPVDGFCYPYGHLSGRDVELVEAAGYDYGCAIWKSKHTGRHALPRTFAGDRDHAARLLAKRLRHELKWRRPAR